MQKKKKKKKTLACTSAQIARTSITALCTSSNVVLLLARVLHNINYNFNAITGRNVEPHLVFVRYFKKYERNVYVLNYS